MEEKVAADIVQYTTIAWLAVIIGTQRRIVAMHLPIHPVSHAWDGDRIRSEGRWVSQRRRGKTSQGRPTSFATSTFLLFFTSPY